MHLPSSDLHFRNVNRYQPNTFDLAVSLTKDFSLAIDVGAHVGFWTKELLGKFDNVIAIEPVRENFECLVKNAPGAECINLACGTGGFVDLHNPAPTNSGAWESAKGSEVKVISIDSLNVSPGLIKIDVQGFEEEVIKGASETIKRCKPVLCVEVVVNGVEHEGLVDLIKSLGYKIGASVNKDRVFIPEEQ